MILLRNNRSTDIDLIKAKIEKAMLNDENFIVGCYSKSMYFEILNILNNISIYDNIHVFVTWHTNFTPLKGMQFWSNNTSMINLVVEFDNYNSMKKELFYKMGQLSERSSTDSTEVLKRRSYEKLNNYYSKDKYTYINYD